MTRRRSWAWLLVGLLASACNDRYTIGAEHPASSTGNATSTSTGEHTGTTTDAATEAGSGSGSSSGSSSSGAPLCSAELGATPCETCLGGECCDPVLACLDLDACRCVLECRIEGHSLESCETDCGDRKSVV